MEAVKGIFQTALDVMDGQIHVLVNCAGIQRRAPALQFSEQDWDDVSVSLFSFQPYTLFRRCTVYPFVLFPPTNDILDDVLPLPYREIVIWGPAPS